tara:strand:- start:2557 stop:4392 length:1836 start_codon:yes stop_codon:yes gene_type:complete
MPENDKPKKKRKFTAADFSTIAEFIVEEHANRKDRRKHLEKVWAEVDRQIRMEPDLRRKLDTNNKVRRGSEWMSEMELPLQAQTLEVLTADARRMLFPDSGSFFEAHAALTDKYLARVDFQALVTGDELEVPSQINQENADQLVAGWLEHYHRQYDFAGNWDGLNAESFKYGTLVGRGRIASKQTFLQTARGVVEKKIEFPVLFPISIKNTYLDDTLHAVMNEGLVVGPAVIYERTQRLKDLQIAANKGSNDPDVAEGGWMPAAVKGLEGDKDGNIHLLEYEGDLVVPRKTVRSVFTPNVIVTVAIGTERRVVRFRFSDQPSYISHPYHVEDVNSPYGSGPLMKGMPVQKAAAEAWMSLTDVVILNAQPPVTYDQDDPFFAGSGGPIVAPRERWASASEVKPVPIGDPNALFAIFSGALQQYADITGVNAPRLGQRTASHTTAFAKDAELQRGQVRTVDYARSVLKGPMEQWLYLEFKLGRKIMKEETFFLREYGGFVTIQKKHLPDMATFDAFGAGGPAEDRADTAQKQSALAQAIQLEEAKRQLQPDAPPLDLVAIQRQILREGFVNVEEFFAEAPVGVSAQSPAGGEVPVGPEGASGAEVAALAEGPV